jgi:hypothetical protein
VAVWACLQLMAKEGRLRKTPKNKKIDKTVRMKNPIKNRGSPVLFNIKPTLVQESNLFYFE